MQGFDIVAGGQLAALPSFQQKFGILQANGSYLLPARYLSAWNAIAPACEVVSTFFFAPMLEKYGRKPGILVAAFISVAGILLQQLAGDWKTHLAGRGVNGACLRGSTALSTLLIWLIRNRHWHDVHHYTAVDWRSVPTRTTWFLLVFLQH